VFSKHKTNGLCLCVPSRVFLSFAWGTFSFLFSLSHAHSLVAEVTYVAVSRAGLGVFSKHKTSGLCFVVPSRVFLSFAWGTFSFLSLVCPHSGGRGYTCCSLQSRTRGFSKHKTSGLCLCVPSRVFLSFAWGTFSVLLSRTTNTIVFHRCVCVVFCCTHIRRNQNPTNTLQTHFCGPTLTRGPARFSFVHLTTPKRHTLPWKEVVLTQASRSSAQEDAGSLGTLCRRIRLVCVVRGREMRER
jgi:uncharacterized protein (DUF486 family)